MEIRIESYYDGWSINIGDKSFRWDHNEEDLGTIGIKKALEELGHKVEIEECY